jgi:hypothetical protein
MTKPGPVLHSFPCREPGCYVALEKTSTASARRARTEHENGEHPDSLHRTWACPGPGDPHPALYDEEGLRTHMQRAHGIIGQERESLWPGVLADHVRRVEALWRAVEANGGLPAPEETAPAAEAPSASPEPSDATAANELAEAEIDREAERTRRVHELEEFFADYWTMHDNEKRYLESLREHAEQIRVRDEQIVELSERIDRIHALTGLTGNAAS